jgi:hypothetical protein
MGRAGFSYSDVAIEAIDTIDTLGHCNQNTHFDELDAGDDTVKVTDSICI